MKIGELGKQADCQVETIRYYEREGLLPVPGPSKQPSFSPHLAGSFLPQNLPHRRNKADG